MTPHRASSTPPDIEVSSPIEAPIEAPSSIEHGRTPGLVTSPAADVDLVEWLQSHRDRVDRWLVEHGALLFRGFGVDSAARFRAVAAACSRELLNYTERSSPRTLVEEHVYTSTDYPPDQSIFPHNEHSYATRFPGRICFGCVVAAETGGETPVVDCRRVLGRIPVEIQTRFRDRGGWMYVRNFSDGLGLPWRTVYQTDSRSEVEQYCRANGIELEWKSGDRLKTTQVRPATLHHPTTGEEIWFNHATFFNVGTLPAMLRDTLLQLFAVEDLPNHTYYGDGTPIEPETLTLLQEAYLAERVIFPWERGDVLLIDNILMAHARNPYSGARQVLVSMADPVERPR
jgi:alpha-ketoglutarate-dependent taurine dioxygenase